MQHACTSRSAQGYLSPQAKVPRDLDGHLPLLYNYYLRSIELSDNTAHLAMSMTSVSVEQQH